MLDFANMSMLVGPRFRRLIGERYDRERLAKVKHAKNARKHPKRHAVNAERSALERQRADERTKAEAVAAERKIAFRAAVRAYWAGDRESYPAL